MTFPKWFKKDGVLKLFAEQPMVIGWEPANGHYDFALGVWVDDKPEKKEKKAEPVSDLKALRAEYGRLSGKKPFMGWDEEKLYKKILALGEA